MTEQIVTPQSNPVSFSVPPIPDFSTAALQGTMQQILSMNLGKYVHCEFLIGSDTQETKTGILYYVGESYVVLYDDALQNYIVCDAYPLKFVTFSTPEQQPAEEPRVSRNPENPDNTMPERGIQEQQPSAIPQGNQLAPLRPITGIRAVGEASQVKAAFNYAKRKARP